jgi:serine phosphatase RsbU (regulator of sigma subunit)
VVYAELAEQTGAKVTFPPGSPFSGLEFALYLGKSAVPAGLIESTVPTPFTRPGSSRVTSFGSSSVTEAVELPPNPSGVLPSGLPWWIGLGSLAISFGAGGSVEALVRRRESAESDAAASRLEVDSQRAIAQTLQRFILPEAHPVFPGLEIATRYLAGTRNLDVGGDWYDTIALGEGRLFITVGDVAGRGLDAATVMSSLRHAIRAYATQGDGPATVLDKLDGLIGEGRGGGFATVFCARVDVTSRRLEASSAGHPPPLVVDGRGSHFLEVPVRPPVGVPIRRPTASVAVAVESQALLLAYTDGLIERRGETLDDGLERLRVAGSTNHRPLEAVVDHILSELLPDGTHDDVAVLALRWEN